MGKNKIRTHVLRAAIKLRELVFWNVVAPIFADDIEEWAHYDYEAHPDLYRTNRGGW